MRGSTADRVHDAMRDCIVRLQIPPGAPLRENVLVGEFGASRGTIREVIKRLATERLAQLYWRRGAFASPITLADFDQLAEIGSQLEAQAAHRAANRVSQAASCELSAVLEHLRQRGHECDGERFVWLHARVHRFIHASVDNCYLEDALARYFNLHLRVCYLLQTRFPRPAEMITDDMRLLDAIVQADDISAERIASEIAANLEQTIRKLL